MKTPERTILPDNTHEQLIYELELIRWHDYYALAVMLLFLNGLSWWLIPFSQLIKERVLVIVIVLVTLTAFLLAFIMWVVMMSTLGDIYFYERRGEMHSLLQFMKRKVIYYDKMHVHIGNMGRVTLNHYETYPKF